MARREGAIYHLFERLGKNRDENLDSELREILKERGAEAQDTFEAIVARARVLDVADPVDYDTIVEEVSRELSEMTDLSAEYLIDEFRGGRRLGATPVSRGVALPHLQHGSVRVPALVCVRSRSGVDVPVDSGGPPNESSPVHAFFFSVSPADYPGRHLQMLAHLARRIDEPQFMDEWLAAESTRDLKETLLHHERYLTLHLRAGTSDERMIGKQIQELALPVDVLIALIRRNGETIIPHGDTRLQAGDRVMVIGHPEALDDLQAD